MGTIIIPIISVHRCCQIIDGYIRKEQTIDLLNAYIKQNHLEIEKIHENDERYGWQILCDTIDEFNDANKLDFIGQVFDARYITDEYDYDFIDEFLKKYNFKDVQQEIFNQLAMFSSDAIKAQQEFSARLGAAHPKALEEWNRSIDLFRSRYYSESGNDIRKSLEFLLRDILENKTSIEQQVKGTDRDVLKSNLGKYLSNKGINKINITFLINIITSITHISNEKFKHGEPTGLSEKDLRFYMNETFLVMQRLLDIEDNQ